MLPPTAKPYLVRAIYEWCLAEGHTPYLLVAAPYPGVRFPPGYAKDGRLTLNIAPRAVERLDLGLDRVRFLARFGGQVHGIEVPITAVMAVFAAETHDGVVFGEPPAPAAGLEPTEAGEGGPEEAPEPTEGEPEPKAAGPRLRLVE